MANEAHAEGILVILVDREGRMLLQLRDARQGVSQPGLWCIPGGALEAGESPGDAARRELQEEIGQAVEPLHFVGSARPERHAAYIFCGGARFSEEAIVVGEGQAFRFFSPEELRRLQPIGPSVIPLLDSFMTDALFERCRQDAQRR